MPNTPRVTDLKSTIVLLSDHRGEQARYTVDYAGESVIICGYVFKGRHRSPLALHRGLDYRFGAPTERGWLSGRGVVSEIGKHDTVTLNITELQLEQRRDAYREEVIVPLEVDVPGETRPRRGSTVNLSIGGVAARIDGVPLPNRERVTMELALPDDERAIVVRAEKVGGDIEQRFRFIEIDRRERERIAKVVREAELEKRRHRAL